MSQLTLWRTLLVVSLAATGAARAMVPDAAAAESKLRAIIASSRGAAPPVVRIEAIVSPQQDNRAIEFVADSDGYFRSSTIALEGERAPRLHVVQFRSLPPGPYDIRVTLLDVRGDSRAMVYQRVMVSE